MADVLESPQATKLQRQLQVGAAILERTANLAASIPASRNAIFDLAFNSGLSPQDAFDGVDIVAGQKVSLSLVMRDAALVAFGAAQLPDAPMPQPGQFGFALAPSVGSDGRTPDGGVVVSDVQAPTATIGAPLHDTNNKGASIATLVVTYADNLGVDPATITPDNLATEPALKVTGVTTAGTGKSVTATYTLDASGAKPGQQYTVVVSGVKDASGNTMETVKASFTI